LKIGSYNPIFAGNVWKFERFWNFTVFLNFFKKLKIFTQFLKFHKIFENFHEIWEIFHFFLKCVNFFKFDEIFKILEFFFLNSQKYQWKINENVNKFLKKFSILCKKLKICENFPYIGKISLNFLLNFMKFENFQFFLCGKCVKKFKFDKISQISRNFSWSFKISRNFLTNLVENEGKCKKKFTKFPLFCQKIKNLWKPQNWSNFTKF
jgi:hypothetical protein